MKKLIFSVLILSVMLMMVGSVSAQAFTNPSAGDVGGIVDVEWTNTEGIPLLFIQYGEGTCLSVPTSWHSIDGPMDISELSSSWDTTSVVNGDGEYCLRLQGSVPYDKVEVTVDNTAPDVDFDWSPTDLIVFETVTFTSIATDTGSGIDTYSWDFGDGDTSTLENPTHVYDEADTYLVALTVTDNVGNPFTYSKEIEISDLETESESFNYEAGILGIAPILDINFGTGLTLTECTVIPTSDEITNVAVGFSGSDCTILETLDIPYDERGVHEIVIKATDGTTIKYYDITITVYTWWIPLTEGWNLISIPMMPEDTSIDSVFGNIIENVSGEGTSTATIFQYDATNEDWYRARLKIIGSGFTGDDLLGKELDTIIPGYGYGIKMANVDVLKGYGRITPEMGSILGIDVANGYNLIGHYGLDTLDYTTALSSLMLGAIEYFDSVSSDTGDMETGVGYWMTAKFLPGGEAPYTPSQASLDSVLL